MSKRSTQLTILLAALVSPLPLTAQSACTTITFPVTLDGPRLLQPSSEAWHLRWESELADWACGDGPGPVAQTGITVRPVALRSSYRSAYPVDRNNGAVWEGKGATLSVHGGARYVGRHVKVTIAPRIAFQQNASYLMAPVAPGAHPLSYPRRPFDWPQRFGERAFWTLDPGESSLVLSAGPGELAVGTENLWWGPARRFPLLFGSSGPGFPHIRIGLTDPVSIGIGSLRVRMLWGQLDESEYFNANAADDLRLLTGAFFELQPSFLPGFTFGLSGVQHNDWRDASRLYLDLFGFAFGAAESSEGNGLLSLTAEWRDTDGFAVYVEWARDDYWLNVEDLLTEPDHAQAYTIGFEKLYRRSRLPLRLSYELTHLGKAAPEQTGRSNEGVKFYTHGIRTQGHTHRGQLLGAWIGPGSDAQYLALNLEPGPRVIGTYLERVRHDEDDYYAFFDDPYGFRGHDVEWSVGLQGLEPAGPLQLQWQGGISRRKNRSFIGLDGDNWHFRRETNVELTLTGWWLPGR